jgi:hypothetical protein
VKQQQVQEQQEQLLLQRSRTTVVTQGAVNVLMTFVPKRMWGAERVRADVKVLQSSNSSSAAAAPSLIAGVPDISVVDPIDND